MFIATFLFYLFASVMVLAAFAVITVKNPVHAVLSLIVAFFNAGALFILLGAELLGMLIVIVYVGAVAVLFLFVVMMLNIRFSEMREGFLRYLPLGGGVALLLFAQIAALLFAEIEQPHHDFQPPTVTMTAEADEASKKLTNTEAIGMVLYTDYFLAVQLAGLVLLVAMIGAIVLTHRQREGVKKQDIAQQIHRDGKRSVKLVNSITGKGVS